LNRNLTAKLRIFLKNEKITDFSNKKLLNKSNEIRNKIDSLQNPVDCESAKKFFCVLVKNCGFGCQIHFILTCFLNGFYRNRTVIFKDSKIKKKNFNRYYSTFKQFSKCDYLDESNVVLISKIFFIISINKIEISTLELNYLKKCWFRIKLKSTKVTK
jgi:hypothetical protein